MERLLVEEIGEREKKMREEERKASSTEKEREREKELGKFYDVKGGPCRRLSITKSLNCFNNCFKNSDFFSFFLFWPLFFAAEKSTVVEFFKNLQLKALYYKEKCYLLL